MMGGDPNKDPAIFPYVVVGFFALVILMWGYSLVHDLYLEFKQWRADRKARRAARLR